MDMPLLKAAPESPEIDPKVAHFVEAIEGLATPCYVFSPSIVVDRYERLRSALGTPLIVSIKANPSIDLFVRCAQKFVDGVELASIGELNLVVGRANIPKYVTSPSMNLDFLSAAIASRATVILDSLHQVDMLCGFAGASGKAAKVAIRLNAASVLSCSNATVIADHFGLDVPSANEACRRLVASGFNVAGVHVYAGSYSFEKVGIAIARAVHGIISKLQELLATPIEFVNLGGGFSENWMVSDTFPSYVKEVCRLQERVTVVHESGRAIFSECGVFVTKVIAVKTIDDRVIVVSDGGLAHAFLLAQTEKVIKNRAVPYVVRRGNAPILSTTQRIDVVGSSCNQSDIIGHLPPGEVPAVGDDLIFWDCGSYHTYTPTGFLNLRPVGRFIIS